MNRRGFFRALAAGVAMLAAPRIAMPAAVPPQPITITVDQERHPYDLRRAYMDGLSQWFTEQLDAALIASLANGE